MNSRFRSDWPKGRVDRLKELWPTHSGAEIAREFGCSRSSICGKVSKLVALGEIEPKLSEPEIQRRARTRTKNEEAANPKPPKPEPEVCAPVKLAETTSRHCRFPMWTDNGWPDFPVCGRDKSVGSVYCDPHKRRVSGNAKA